MSDAYIGVPFINQVSTTFPKEDFSGSAFGSVTGAHGTYSNAIELSIDVPGSEAGNIEVLYDNVRQEPDVAYSVHEDSSNRPRVLNFSESVSSTASIYVIHKGVGPYNMTPPNNSVGATQLTEQMKTFTTDVFAGDGSTTDFTLSETPANVNTLLVIVDGIVQKATTNYTLASTTLSFTSAPDASAEIEVKHLGVRGIVRRGPDWNLDNFSGDGSTTAFTLTTAGVNTNSAWVYYNGVMLKPTTDYTVNSSSGVMTLTFAPTSGSELMVRYQN
jgi:hypothetical protein